MKIPSYEDFINETHRKGDFYEFKTLPIKINILEGSAISFDLSVVTNNKPLHFFFMEEVHPNFEKELLKTLNNMDLEFKKLFDKCEMSVPGIDDKWFSQ